MGYIETTLYVVLGIGLACMIGFWIYMEKQYVHRVRIRQIVNGRKIIKDHKARDWTDKDGVSWWRISGEKVKYRKLMPLPPEECIDIDKKGKKIVECYRTEGGEVIFIKDTAKMLEFPLELYDNIPQELLDMEEGLDKKEAIDKYKKAIKDEWMKLNNVVEPYQPFTTKQRLIYVNNIKKAEARKQFSWQQALIPIASMAIVAIIVVALVVFWGEIAAPAIQANSQAVQISENQLQMTKLLYEIKTGRQIVQGEAPPSQTPTGS